MTAEESTAEAIRIASSLFGRGRTSGSSGNISFIYEENVYISASGTCFGMLSEDDFSRVSMEGTLLSGRPPSRELALHLSLYRRHKSAKAVLHTHSFHATLWSCLEHEAANDVMPDYTPYLRMRVGRIPLVPYALPGSPELFDLFEKHIESEARCYLLAHHGPILAGESLSSVFFDLEELEDSARIAYSLALLDSEGEGVPKNIGKFHAIVI
jgi:ribulose-5-phosphate 4-epimerase/fuculose-1-phosphate aldolase